MKASIVWEIPAELARVDAICQDAQSMLADHGLSDRGFAVELLLREFANNAIIHGSRLDPQLRVFVTMAIGRRWIRLEFCDQGPGFDWRKSHRELPNVEATSGRGLPIAQQYAGRLAYNHKGNHCRLWIDRSETRSEKHD
jgi:serine/threonine-protein kinase RsbW